LKKVLLIGGAGFIGHNLAVELNRKEFEVSIADSFSVNNVIPTIIIEDLWRRDLYNKFLRDRIDLLMSNNIPIYLCDARNYNDLSFIINKKVKPDVVIHLAAVSHANRSNKDPYSTFDHSLKTLENALDSSINGVVKHFIYFSSSMVYGDFPVYMGINGGQGRIVNEESPTEPRGIYGVLKLAGEKIVKVHGDMYSLPYTIIRPSALYGERCISGRVVQKFIELAIKGENLLVSGSMDEMLDFTYIDDLVSGICLAICKDKAYGEIFNLTYGEGRTLFDLINILDKEVGVAVTYGERDKDMSIRGTLSISKAKKILGYSPKYSIEAGVKKYIEWYRGQIK